MACIEMENSTQRLDATKQSSTIVTLSALPNSVYAHYLHIIHTPFTQLLTPVAIIFIYNLYLKALHMYPRACTHARFMADL